MCGVCVCVCVRVCVCVCVNSLQPCYLTQASVKVGAAATAGEEEKDPTHDADVTQCGGHFYPLVVEIELWLFAPVSLKTLQIIASKATTFNGISFSQEFANFMQQLSVCLWQGNAKKTSVGAKHRQSCRYSKLTCFCICGLGVIH